MRAGDRIRWTRNRKAPLARGSHPQAPDLVNGGEAEIVEIGYKRVRFRDGEREFSIALTDPQLRHLDHAYCSTVHSAQGRTARGAIAVLDAGGWVDPELFHVELSRVSEAFLLLTDDREALIERLEAQDWSEDGALEALGIDLSEPPVVDPEEFAALAADWRALLREGEGDEHPSLLPRGLPGRDGAGCGASRRSRTSRRTCAASPAPCWRNTRGISRVTARCAASSSACATIGGAGRSSAGRPPRRDCPSRSLPNTIPGARKGWRFWRRAVPGSGRTARPHAISVPCRERAPAWKRPSRCSSARGSSTMPNASNGRGTRFANGPRRSASRSCMRPATGWWRRRAKRLEAAEGLDAHVRRAVAEWRKIDSAQTALAEEVGTLPGRIAAWRERRADLPQDEPGGLDPKHPARHAWREEGGALEAVAKDMLHPKSVHAPHPGRRGRPARGYPAGGAGGPGGAARRPLPGIRVADGGGGPGRRARPGPRRSTCRAMARWSRRRRHSPGRRRCRRTRRKLSPRGSDYHAGCQSICRQIRDWPARVDALTADCPERPATLDALRDWRQRAEPLLAEARAMPEKDGPHAPHLAAMPGERKALVKATSSLESALLAVEAREKNVLSAVVRRSAEEFHRDWNAHVSRAMTAHAHPFYVVGHTELIDRLQQLRNQPAVTALPASELEPDRLHPRRSPAADQSRLARPGIPGPDRALPHPAAAAKRTRPYPEIGAPRRPLLRRMARHRRAPPRGGEGHRR